MNENENDSPFGAIKRQKKFLRELDEMRSQTRESMKKSAEWMLEMGKIAQEARRIRHETDEEIEETEREKTNFETIRCPSCGAKMPAGSRFCGICGNEF